MNRDIKSVKKSISISFREDILLAIDRFIEKKEKEIGCRFTRSSFIEGAVIAKVEGYGLMKEDKDE